MYQEYVKKAAAAGKAWDELPERVRAVLSPGDYRARVREVCIQQGLPWDSSHARSVSAEQEYYEALVAAYRGWGRLYPYHLQEYVARVLRITPFKYYSDLLFQCLKDELSYDRIPNFTAADALRLTGVGRNAYISLLNACKAKRLLWRVNKGLARDLLPQRPVDIRMERWWRVSVVNVGEAEFRELGGAEASLLRAAAEAGQPPPVSAFERDLLQALYKRGLIYLEVPIGPEERFSVPPLEGFVSNKNAQAGDEGVDPNEQLLYQLFIANSSTLDQAHLADILGVDLQQLLLATSVAVRLGFATRLGPGSDDPAAGAAGPGGGALLRPASNASSLGGLSVGPGGSSQALSIPDAAAEGEPGAAAAAADAWAAGAAGAGSGGGASQGAIAVVVDAATTAGLMMGALSPGVKRHSVTLFEGGRVGGEAVIDELIAELAASAATSDAFQGEDMAQLMRSIQSLGILLAAARVEAAAQGHQLELLRQESLAGLDAVSASKVLSATYTAILPIAPLPGSVLPRLLQSARGRQAPGGQAGAQQQQQQQQQQQPSPPGSSGALSSLGQQPGPARAPAFFGPPCPEAETPWLQLALYAAARAGPVCLVFAAGVRVWRLPPQLQDTTHALLWSWGPAMPASALAAGATGSNEARPMLVEGTSLLCTLNELLTRTAMMVQPLVHLGQLPSLPAAQHLVRFVDVPLPLCPLADEAQPEAAQEQQQQAQQQAQQLEAQQPGTMESPGQLQEEQQRPVVVQAVDRTGPTQGQQRLLEVPRRVVDALQQLQLSGAVGWLRLVKLPPPPASTPAVAPGGGTPAQPWLPLSVDLGVPLFCPELCSLVCANLHTRGSLTPSGMAGWNAGGAEQLQAQLLRVASGSGGGRAGWGGGGCGGGGLGSGLGGSQLPCHALLFDGHALLPVDLGDCLQGPGRLW